MAQTYTRRDVGRILGVEAARLQYWERLRLVRPRARWGERFYSFADLVALRAIHRLTQKKVPALRLKRAVDLVEQQFGAASLPIEQLSLVEHGREIVVIPPGAARPFNPFRRQWVLPFESASPGRRLHTLPGRTAEELFEQALDCEANPDLIERAILDYQLVTELAPTWVEAHINLGVALYQAGRVGEARAAFATAVSLDPLNGISRYNLGCVLEEQGQVEEALDHLTRAARAMPAHADVRFNLALAYEKRGERAKAREQWELYLRYAPNGPWADQARARLKACSGRRKSSAPIPFRPGSGTRNGTRPTI